VKYCIQTLLSMLVGIYLFISVFLILVGASYRYEPKNSGCDEPKTRYRYLFPTYEFGCWLGEIPKQ